MTGYQKLKRIGSGTFGEVWVAQDVKRKQQVALKFFRSEMVDQVDSFKREFEILSELHHTHLARVFDFGFSPEDKSYFFASEFCPGRELYQAVEQHPFSYFEACLVQILSALDYLYAQNVIHFDIKGSNILVSEIQGRPDVKVVDFGIASRKMNADDETGDGTSSEMIKGTLSHMAPEIIRRSGLIDHRADLYSLGMVCLRALTGRFPFDTSDTKAVLNWQLHGTIPEKIWEGTNIPRYLKEITERLLQKNPSDRFSHPRVVLNLINLATHRKYVDIEQGLSTHIPLHGPLIERDTIISSLKKGVQSVLSSEESSPISPMQMINLLRGEDGIGKSRVMEEIIHFAELQEIPVFEIVCDYEVPTWPLLAAQLGLEEGRESVKGILTEEEAQWAILSWVEQILARARRRPFCLMIDDFHKADRQTQKIIAALRDRPRAPLYILLAAKETSSQETAGNQPLSRLTLAGVQSYIELVLGETERNRQIAEILYQYSGGLPLLMVEGLRYLAPHFYRGESLENLLPPPGLAHLYEEKLQALTPEDREALDLAALLFRPTDVMEFAAILEKESPSSIRTLQKLVRDGLLANEGSFYRVSSQALALSLIQSMTSERKQDLHLKIGLHLKRKGEAAPSEIAYHLSKGGAKSEAGRYYEQATALSQSQGQLQLAADYLKKAIPLYEEGSEAWQRIALEAAYLMIRTGSYQDAESLVRKLEAYPSFHFFEIEGILALKKRAFVQAKQSYENALQQLLGEKDHSKLSEILIKNSLGNVQFQMGDLDGAESAFRETARLESRIDPQERSKISNNQLGSILALKGKIDEAVAFFEERLHNAAGGSESDSIALWNGLGFCLLKGSRYDEGIQVLEKGLALAEKTHSYHFIFSIMGNLLSALLKQGRYAECLPLMQKMLSFQQRFGSTRDLCFNLLRLSGTYLLLGMEEAAGECIAKGRKLTDENFDSKLYLWFSLIDGYREREYGNSEKARSLFQETSEVAGRFEDQELKAWALLALGEMSFENGDRPQCNEFLKEIAPTVKGEEFEIRRDLLHLQIQAETASPPVIDESFSRLEARCQRGHLKEILWMVYHAWSKFCRSHREEVKGKEILEKGIKLSLSLADSLPEEYRHRYLNHSLRKKMLDDWKILQKGSSLKHKPPAMPSTPTIDSATETISERAKTTPPKGRK